MGSDHCLHDLPVFCSWSGGKDSCLALHRAVQAGARPTHLFTMLIEGGERSHSHGLSVDLLRAQSESLGLPIVFREATWDGYEAAFLDGLAELRDQGALAGVFGDIDIDDHRKWVEDACAKAGLRAYEPLWGGGRRELLDEFLSTGYEARVVAVRDGAAPAELLGRALGPEVIAAFESHGADACGENGEYHTVVTGGPLFRASVRVREGERVLRGGCWFVDFRLD